MLGRLGRATGGLRKIGAPVTNIGTGLLCHGARGAAVGLVNVWLRAVRRPVRCQCSATGAGQHWAYVGLLIAQIRLTASRQLVSRSCKPSSAVPRAIADFIS